MTRPPGIMQTFVNRFSATSAESELRRTKNLLSDHSGGLASFNSGWGSQAGFGNLSRGIPTFSVPDVADPTEFLQLHTNDAADPGCRIKINHGTTTLAFCFQGGVIVAVDSRATAGSVVADCQYWETYLGLHCRLHELRNGERISVAAASKYLSNLVYSYKSMGLGMARNDDLWGPSVYYVDADGTRLKGGLFSVGSGSTHAYGVLDQGYRWDLTVAEACELGRRSIYAAGHRDAYSGNSCNLYHIQEDGWRFVGNYDISTMHYEGPGDVPGSLGAPYGYNIRVAGRSSADSSIPDLRHFVTSRKFADLRDFDENL
ncbi:N-terminal nucleophile aminohydrolase [Mycena alexandri]|uniref:proteasome endopeptidase complex n=1 Tax=Mycena alexandri TaxID=1745969 RepID=A0AAD6SQ71_9AGAR|nr:N-terminal nucleophile aminohydrolase [Mycena alexandri]